MRNGQKTDLSYPHTNSANSILLGIFTIALLQATPVYSSSENAPTTPPVSYLRSWVDVKSWLKWLEVKPYPQTPAPDTTLTNTANPSAAPTQPQPSSGQGSAPETQKGSTQADIPAKSNDTTRKFSWRNTWPLGNGWYSQDTPATNAKAPSIGSMVNAIPGAIAKSPFRFGWWVLRGGAKKTGNFVGPMIADGAEKVIDDISEALDTKAPDGAGARTATIIQKAVKLVGKGTERVIDETSNALEGKLPEEIVEKTGKIINKSAHLAAKSFDVLIKETSGVINEAIIARLNDPNTSDQEKAQIINYFSAPTEGTVTPSQWFSALTRRFINFTQDWRDAKTLFEIQGDLQTIASPSADTIEKGAALYRRGGLLTYFPLPIPGKLRTYFSLPQSLDLRPWFGDQIQERKETIAAYSRYLEAQRDRAVVARGVAQVYAAIAGSWILNNSLVKTVGASKWTLPTMTAGTITLLARDLHNYLNVIKPTYVALTPVACPSPKVVGCDRFSISKVAVAKLEQLQKRNKERDNDGNPPIKNLNHDVVATFLEDIRAGRVVIRDRNSVSDIPAIIDVYKEGSAKALDTENIKFTLEREIAELSKAIAFLEENYNRNIDLGEDYYQAGWKFDCIAAKKAAKITPGTMFYDITPDQFKTMDDFMKEKDPIWQVALRIPKIGVACAWYPTRLPYLAQPSRWICSYAMPFYAYQRAKLAWWGFVQQKEAAEAIYRLLVPPAQ